MEMQKIEILRIKNPSDFWICQKNSERFVEIIHEEIKNDEAEGVNSDDGRRFTNAERDSIIGVYQLNTRRWYRAKVLQQDAPFGHDEVFYKCFLIDTGEVVSVSSDRSKRLYNPKLRQIAPLARRCSLFGLVSKNDDNWPHTAIRLFYDRCQKYANCLYMIYKTTSNPLNYKEKNLVKIFYPTEKKPNKNVDSNNNLEIKFKWRCFNDMMVEKGQAMHSNENFDGFDCDYLNDEEELNILAASTLRLNELNEEHDTFEYIKAYLRHQSEQERSEKRLLKLAEIADGDEMEFIVVNNNQKDQLDAFGEDRRVVRSQSELQLPELDDPIFIHGKYKPSPYISIDSIPHKSIKDYLHSIGVATLSEADAYHWPALIRGYNCCIIQSKQRIDANSRSLRVSTAYDRIFSYLCPLMSRTIEIKLDIIDKLREMRQNRQNMRENESGDGLDESLNESRTSDLYSAIHNDDHLRLSNRPQNGPIMIIVCTSCERAQKLIEHITGIIDLSNRSMRQLRLRALMIQGGRKDHEYQVALINGVDILIAATPFVLARMIGLGWTNFERMHMLVFDNGYLLMEKYAAQVRELKRSYEGVLQVQDGLIRAQMVVVTPNWSNKLAAFVGQTLKNPLILCESKLEAAFFGKVHHVLKECESSQEKLVKISEILRSQPKKNNTVICASASEKVVMIYESLKKSEFLEAEVIHEHTKEGRIEAIEKLWMKTEMAKNGLILICQDDALSRLAINNAKTIIHFDFPLSSKGFGNRLWLMRRHFGTSTETIRTSRNAEHSIVADDNERLCSHIFFRTKSKIDRSNALDLYAYLSRIGIDDKYFSAGFLKTVEECKREKEQENVILKAPLCPFLKAYGSCAQLTATRCQYRHTPDKEMEQVKWLNEEKRVKIPSEGYVKFKVAFVNDTNNFFINISAYQSLKLEPETKYCDYLEMDSQLQLYYSNPETIQYVTSFHERELYAYKDVVSSFFRRVIVLDKVKYDDVMVFEVVVKCIDIGCKLKINSKDLIRLPSRFKKLPPQAIEVYLCDIRPTELDLSWSISSKLIVSEKLAKNKDFYGKIQLAAGEILWLHPINSYKHLKGIGMSIVEDLVTSELITEKYATKNPTHISILRDLFVENGLNVPLLQDVDVDLKQTCMELANSAGLLHEPSFAFLRAADDQWSLPNSGEQVYVSASESPAKFYVQIYEFNKQLDDINTQIEAFLKRMEFEKKKEESKFEMAKEQLKEDKKEKKDGEKEEESSSDDEDDDDCVSEEYKEFSRRLEALRFGLTAEKLAWFNLHRIPIYCLAKTNNDNAFNRVRVVSSEREDKYRVFFVDYGDYEVVDLADLLPIDEKFVKLLPFQAIQCSLHGIKPLKHKKEDGSTKEKTVEWSKESDDNLWSLTHDEEEFHRTIYSQVVADQTPSKEDDPYSHKRYSVRLKLHAAPAPIDVAHRLAARNTARLTSEELLRVFGFKEDEEGSGDQTTPPENRWDSLGAQFVKYFIRWPVLERQQQLMRFLKNRIFKYQTMRECELVSTGVIQSISKALAFIHDESHLKWSVNFLHGVVISPVDVPREKIKNIFVGNDGLSNLFLVESESFKSNQIDLAKIARDFIYDLIESSEFVREHIANSEPYLRALWLLMDDFTDEVDRIVRLFRLCLQHIEPEKLFSRRFLDFSYNVKSDILLSLRDRVSENNYALLNDLFHELEKREECPTADVSLQQQPDILDDTETDYEKDRQLIRRVSEYILSHAEMAKSHQPSDNEEEKSNNNKRASAAPNKNKKTEYTCSPPDSSSDEIYENFIDDLGAIFRAVMSNPPSSQPPAITSPPIQQPPSISNRDDFVPPKMSWDQTMDTVVLKVFLKGVKNSNLEYKNNFISFRCLLGETLFGFDLHLFAEIDEKSVLIEPQTDFYQINVKKKYNGIWPRLLTSLVKPSYIKSEFNNLNVTLTSEDEDNIPDRESKVNHLGRIHRLNLKNKKKRGKNDESSRSDSSSDFNDNPFDMKEDRENFW